MSHSALSSTIETALSHTIVARLLLEGCELLIGSEHGAVLLPAQTEERSFNSLPLSMLPPSTGSGCESILGEVLKALHEKRSIEVSGIGHSALLRSLAGRSELIQNYPHGILYLNQSDAVEDLLQTIFEQFYQVGLELKPSRAEIRVGLSDRQALILLDQPNFAESELEQLGQTLPQSTFAIASVERRFPRIDCVISNNTIDLRLLSSQEQTILELLATVESSLTAEQISAIANVSDLQRLIDLGLIHVDQNRYELQTRYQSSDLWMEKVLNYVLAWIRTQPTEITKERALLIRTVQWSADHERWLEVVEIVRSTESAFAIAKLWGSWSKMLRLSLAAAWALEDEAIEAWALHQLGTLAFCQEEVTTGYDTLSDALALRTELQNQTAIAFTQHNIEQVKALIVPVESEDQTKLHQRHFYWIVGMIFAIVVSVSIGVGILVAQQSSNQENCSSLHWV